jgi:hypothetical protein
MGVIEKVKLEKPSASYDQDFYAWCIEQAARIRAGAPIDQENVAEEIESMGRSDKRQIESRLEIILMHLLKWHFQPEHRSNSWRTTINEQRRGIRKLIAESPSLASYPAARLADAYTQAREGAIDETGVAASVFPDACPYTLEDALEREVQAWDRP